MAERWAWATGLFEGEGCITRTRRPSGDSWRLYLTSTDRDVVERFHRIVGVGWIHVRRKVNGRPNAKTAWIWGSGAAKDVALVLRKMQPLLGRRRGARARQCLRGVEK